MPVSLAPVNAYLGDQRVTFIQYIMSAVNDMQIPTSQAGPARTLGKIG